VTFHLGLQIQMTLYCQQAFLPHHPDLCAMKASVNIQQQASNGPHAARLAARMHLLGSQLLRLCSPDQLQEIKLLCNLRIYLKKAASAYYAAILRPVNKCVSRWLTICLVHRCSLGVDRCFLLHQKRIISDSPPLCSALQSAVTTAGLLTSILSMTWIQRFERKEKKRKEKKRKEKKRNEKKRKGKEKERKEKGGGGGGKHNGSLLRLQPGAPQGLS